MARRVALLIGNAVFEDANTFPPLHTPANDVDGLAEVLERYGKFEIANKLINESYEKIRWAIDEFYNEVQRGDLTLLYYSGHGTRDRNRQLYFATKNTDSKRLLSSGLQASFIHDAISLSNCKHRIIILDCCFSGTFIKGEKSAREPLLLDNLKGEATAILASSGMSQSSFEEHDSEYSLFTQYLIEGIKTGNADGNGDGRISINDLYQYIDKNVRNTRPEQTPMMESSVREEDIIIATSSPKLNSSKSASPKISSSSENRSQIINRLFWRMQRITSLIAIGTEPKELMKAILEGTLEVFEKNETPAAAFCEYDEMLDDFNLATYLVAGRDKIQRELMRYPPRSNGMAHRIIKYARQVTPAQRPIYINSTTRNWPAWLPALRDPGNPRTASIAYLPLITKSTSTTVGLIMLQFSVPHAFTKEEKRELNLFTDIAANALSIIRSITLSKVNQTEE